MTWRVRVVALLVAVTAGWMIFDGARAIAVGDYVTPTAGPDPGRLGPWAGVAEAVGIAPRSTLMKSIFVVYGVGLLAALVPYVAGTRGSRALLAVAVALGLWYLPFGTLAGIVVLVLLGLAGPR